jgi:hypothetical protein
MQFIYLHLFPTLPLYFFRKNHLLVISCCNNLFAVSFWSIKTNVSNRVSWKTFVSTYKRFTWYVWKFTKHMILKLNSSVICRNILFNKHETFQNVYELIKTNVWNCSIFNELYTRGQDANLGDASMSASSPKKICAEE